METAALLKKAGSEYDKNILNDVKNVDNYTAASKQALNLGIYGADLSYASVFNNTQESMLYTSCAQKLAKKLDVTNAFNEEVVSRLEKNRNNRDSLLSIISETYWHVDAYLKENQRDNISALMVAGRKARKRAAGRRVQLHPQLPRRAPREHRREAQHGRRRHTRRRRAEAAHEAAHGRAQALAQGLHVAAGREGQARAAQRLEEPHERAQQAQHDQEANQIRCERQTGQRRR